jgi:hypothetical protein
MAIKVGEFLFAIGFGKPDTRNLLRAEKEATRAIRSAQKAVADGAEDAAEQIEAAAKAVAKHARESKKEITGWGKALGDVGKAASKAAKDYTAAWREPEKLTEAWGKALGRAKTILTGVAGGAAAAAGGLGALVHSTTESDAELVRWSSRLGLSVRELSKLEQAAAGFADKDAIREGLQTLTENLGELSSQGSGPALEALRTLKLSLADLEGQEATVQLETIADALEGVGEGEGMQAVLELFGGGDGAKLLPFLREGADGMAALAAEAEHLGLVVGDDAAAGSAELARELGQVVAMVKALAADVVRGLLPEVKRYVGLAKDWAKQNGEIVKSKLREFVAELIPRIVELVGALASIVSAGMGLVDSLGGMSNALTIAAVAFGALQVAALGVPGVILAASAALAIGITELAGYRDEARKLREETDYYKNRGSNAERSLAATAELNRHRREGTLGDLSDDEYQRLTEDFYAGTASRTTAEQAAAEDRLDRTDAARSEQQSRQARTLTAEQALEGQLRDRLRSRAKRKRLRTGEAAIETAVTAFKQARREGSDSATAAKAAAEKLDALGGVEKGGAKKEKIDTTRARELFGADLDRIAGRDGAGAAAVKSALEDAQKEINAGSTEGVQRAAAYARLGKATGREYKTGADGKDPLLSTLLGKDVPDIEMGKLALGASPTVLNVVINNTITVDAPITIPGAGSPGAVGLAAASHIKGIVGDLAKAHKLAKVVWSR